jgi:putative heme-binding domain-containing protein
MWALATSGGAPVPWLMRQLDDRDENIRAWAIRFLTDEGAVSGPALKKFVRMAARDQSGLVRLTLASTLQRIPAAERGTLARPLIAHSEDASDHNMPLMLWYGIEPMAEADLAAFATMEWQTQIPLLRKFIARRITEEIERRPAVLNALLETVVNKGSVEQQFEVLDGMCLALHGWRKAPKPASWDASAGAFLASADGRLHDRTTELGAVFGDGRALDELRRVASDGNASPEQRRMSLQTLIENHPANLLSIILPLLGDRVMARPAVQGLALFKDPDLAAQLIANYEHFYAEVRPDVIATLTSRTSFARALLDAVADNKINRHDITAFDARQIHNLSDAKLDELLVKVWGKFGTSSEEKQRQMTAWQAKLTPERLKAADLRHGHQLFLKTCAVCHRLYGEGAFIGPDLTGSGRTDLRYLLENVLDPSAVVAADYKMSVVETKDDRVLSGIVASQNERNVTIQTANARVLLQRDEIQSITASALSMMPEGLLDSLTQDEARDLVAYLMTHRQP